MHPDKPGHHAVGFESDARERSSSQEWDEGNALDDSRSLSSQKSDGGYYSSGALSDSVAHAAAASSSSFDHGTYNPMSSMRSVGSTGSQGSSRGLGHAAVASHLVNGETKFRDLYSYASDAQRSDVATVCSEVESVVSADFNVAQSTTNPHPSSPPTSVKMTVGAGNCVNPKARPANAQLTGSEQRIETVVPPRGLPVQTLQQPQPDPPLPALHNSMGPPLSRSLLLQHPQHHHHTEGNVSQPGSVKSFESNAGSDVVAHVDTDDCGGSLDMDVHSIHSQEDVVHSEGQDSAKAHPPSNTEGEGEEDKKKTVNPLLCSSESNTNGRTSPGGTIYKGRGNRRYQGRYMHLPLKRFHQNGVDLGDERPSANGASGGVEEDCPIPYASHSRPPRRNGAWAAAIESRGDRGRSADHQHPIDNRNPRDRRLLNGSRPRSRSRSRSRSRDRDRDRDIRDHNPSQHYDTYDKRKPRARRWHHSANNGSPENVSHYRGHNRSRGERNGYNGANPTGHGGQGSNRSPNRNRNRRR